MPSLIHGYEYDIFISYRQKDNKHDGWVTQFVENLKGELESTFKEDISIYFDENPHDRLQETHNVDKSLEGKLKCLIFIPVLSQTYCDPASYAWQYEFLAFLRMAVDDRFGKDVKLKSGNFASRILPIRIHDLDPDDVKLFEETTGNVIRTLDFVFRTAGGVNRPLTASEDHPNDNLNKTYYRDQINKVAIAIKEIIGGLKAVTIPHERGEESLLKQSENLPMEESPVQGKVIKTSGQKILAGVSAAAVIMFVLLFFVFPDIFRGGKSGINKDPNGKISIVVNDFDNNTNDTTLNWLRMGIPELIRINLANSEELIVQNSRTMNEVYESIGKARNISTASMMSREAAIKLKAGTYITGSFQKYGDKLLTLVKLIDTRSDELLWTGSSEGRLDRIRFIADSLSEELKNFLEIKALRQQTRQEYGDALTKSSEAYRKYVEGMNSVIKNDYGSALVSFMDSYRLDSASVLATFNIALAYDGLAVFEDTKYRRLAATWTQKAYDKRENLSGDNRLWLEMWHAYYNTKNADEVLKYCGLLEASENRSRLFWFDVGQTYSILNKQEKALKLYQKIEDISSEWNEDWKNVHYYGIYSICLNSLKMYDKEKEILQKGLALFPENSNLSWIRARHAVSIGDSAYVREFIERREQNFRDAGRPLNVTERNIGNLYEQGGAFAKAEEKYRNSIRIDPAYDLGKYSLAYLLIHNDLNVEEGMKYIYELQHKYPDVWDYDFFFLKSEGLYKQGRYASADSLLKILKDSCFTANIAIDQLTQKVSDALRRQN